MIDGLAEQIISGAHRAAMAVQLQQVMQRQKWMQSLCSVGNLVAILIVLTNTLFKETDYVFSVSWTFANDTAVCSLPW